MSSDEVPGNENGDDKPLVPITPVTSIPYDRTVSQNLRYLDDALTHAIDQLNKFNSETMSDLSLKYELIRNNESRVIGFFAHQLMLVQMQNPAGQNGGFHSDYPKLDRFLSVVNINKKSIEYIVQRMTFDDLLNGKAAVREKLLYDAGTTEIERKDFRNAFNALKDCLDYFLHGGTNDHGRFYWHIETPSAPVMTPYAARQHRLSDTVLSVPLSTDSERSSSVSASLSTEFGAVTNTSTPMTTTATTNNPRRHYPTPTPPPPTRSTHLSVNGKRKCEHPSKKSSVDPSIFANVNPSRTMDLQLPDDSSTSRRSSYGSDTDNRLQSDVEYSSTENEIYNLPYQLAKRKLSIKAFDKYYYAKALSKLIHQNATASESEQTDVNNILPLNSCNRKHHDNKLVTKLAKNHLWSRPAFTGGTATPKSPTIRSPTMPGSPMGSTHNSDTENDPKSPDTPFYNTQSPVIRHRMAHKIQHKYKCHKECVQQAPTNCGFSEGKFRRAIDNTDIQNAFAKSTPLTRKYHFTRMFLSSNVNILNSTCILASDSISPTPSTPISAPGSPAPHPSLASYHFSGVIPNGSPSIYVSESIYCTQNDPDSWVVIETNTKTASELPESQSDSDTNSTAQTDTGTNLTDSTITLSNRYCSQLSQNDSKQSARDDFKSKLAISIDDDVDGDPDKRSMDLPTSIQDWVIGFNNIKMIEEVRRSSGSLMKAHWHGELAVRLIKPNPKSTDVEFLEQFKNQIFCLRKVRHEHLNLYTGVCIESPNFAIASNWIRGSTLFEMIHIRNDSIPFNLAVQYAAQIAQAMSYLHEKSINHMSLRTTNIFVQNNRVVLTDYGLVPLSKCYRYHEQPAVIVPRGFLSYLAPEIIRKLDPRNEQTLLQHTPQTDVYAFGTVWYELLFREFPYAKQLAEYIIWRAGNSLKQPLSSVHISKNAKDIINQCWSFVPDDRPDFAMLCKSLTKMPGKRSLVRSPSTPLQYHGHQISTNPFK
ncbi:unnamed protein product [Adineta ricciae]|uniref:Protein kinase domain-containing protein n=1 Tax=Adineta ricciae TaxID=249248 RepID=A0A814GA46_ADIRI|nr:unnamed protein product [Adineta ricciae]